MSFHHDQARFYPREKFYLLTYAALCAAAVWLAFVPIDIADRVFSSERSGGSGILRIGVEFAPRAQKPTDYQTRRAEHLLDELSPSVEKIFQASVNFVALSGKELRAALTRGEIDLAIYPASVHGGGLGIGSPFALAPIMRSDTSIRIWDDLRGRSICVSEESGPARRLVSALGAAEMVFSSPAKSLAAMRQGDCDAALHDERLVRTLITHPNGRWDKFNATLPPRDPERLILEARTGDPALQRKAEKLASHWSGAAWNRLIAQWAADIEFESYLEQDAPDCH